MALNTARNSVSDTEASLKNLTEERAALKRILNNFGKYDDKNQLKLNLTDFSLVPLFLL